RYARRVVVFGGRQPAGSGVRGDARSDAAPGRDDAAEPGLEGRPERLDSAGAAADPAGSRRRTDPAHGAHRFGAGRRLAPVPGAHGRPMYLLRAHRDAGLATADAAAGIRALAPEPLVELLAGLCLFSVGT